MYLKNVLSKKITPQSEPIPGSNQVPNNAGGFAFPVDDWTRLQRFLILGTEAGTYYVSEQKLSRDNAEAVERCIKADGKRAVAEIVGISTSGRAPKVSPAIFALALACAAQDMETRKLALAALPKVCRTASHLFEFLTYCVGDV
jgi:60 kDa SS-A/Ro ribonucleoprotein